MRKAISILLVFVMCLSLLPANAIAKDSSRTEQPLSTELNKGSEIPGTAYHVISKKSYSIAPDISESVIITNNDAGNSQTVANVMQVNPNEGRAKIVAGYGNRNPKELGWTLKTTTEQAHVYERETGLNVVGGVNASWFNINTGEPSGYLVMNGVVHHDNSSRAFLAAFDDGSVNVFREGTTLAQAEASQSEKQGKAVQIVEAVDALVAMVWDGKVVASQSGNGGYYPRTSVGVKADGTVVLFQADGTMAPRSVGYTAEEEARHDGRARLRGGHPARRGRLLHLPLPTRGRKRPDHAQHTRRRQRARGLRHDPCRLHRGCLRRVRPRRRHA